MVVVMIFLLMPNSTSKKGNFLIFFKRRNRKLRKELLRKLQIGPLVDVLEVGDEMVVAQTQRQQGWGHVSRSRATGSRAGWS